MYMNTPFGYGYPVFPPYGPPSGGGGIKDFKDWMELMEEWTKKKEEEAKKAKDSAKKPPEPKKFSRGEVTLLLATLGPFVGLLYMYLLKMAAGQYMEVLQQITK